jgi:hypothetical protein
MCVVRWRSNNSRCFGNYRAGTKIHFVANLMAHCIRCCALAVSLVLTLFSSILSGYFSENT